MEIKETKTFKIESLGEKECDVYDIETENHVFFANDILVHNSVYMELVDVLNRWYESHPDASQNEATDFIDVYAKQIENECLTPLFTKMKEEMNCHPDCDMKMDREAISIPYKKTGYSGIWTAKKHYFLQIMDMEGYRYETPHTKKMGLYSVTSTCPQFVKPYYDQVFYDLIEDGVDKARKTVKEFKKLFYSKSISEISFPKSVSQVKKFVNPKTNLPYEESWYDADLGKERNGGVPINAKAAIYYNYLVDKLQLDKIYSKIKDGDHIRYCYLKENPYKFSVIGFHDDLPKEFELDQYVDYDTHWEKVYYKPITDVFEACNLTVEKTKSLEDFF